MNEKEPTHIDLFSGIGGFALAAKWAGFKTIAFCEKEEFCQRVLQKRFGAVIADTLCSISRRENSGKINNQNRRVSKIGRKSLQSKDREAYSSKSKQSNLAPIIPEIRDFDGAKYRSATILTGGFPCQPFSVAGQRRGKEDDRYLWPEMRRVISEAKPTWILAENVPGIFHMALDTVLADLEGEGYTTGTFIIPACGLNAPHRRNRIWIVAWNAESNSSYSYREISQRKNSIPRRSNSYAPDSESRMPGKQAEQERGESFSGGNIKDDTNSDRFNGNNAGFCSSEISFNKKTEIFRGNITDSSSKGLSESQEGQLSKSLLHAQRGDWEKDWYEVATQFCRVDDGVSDRIHRLKALGNAIVPQIAYEILKNIAWMERTK